MTDLFPHPGPVWFLQQSPVLHEPQSLEQVEQLSFESQFPSPQTGPVAHEPQPKSSTSATQ